MGLGQSKFGAGARTLAALALLLAGASVYLLWDRLTPHGLHEGDVIFQTNRMTLSRVLGRAARGTYNHVGLLLRTPHGLKVYEVAGSVHFTRFDHWVRRGQGWHYAVRRLAPVQAELSPEVLAKLRIAARGMDGREEDPVFSWDDPRLYSSEMVWKAYKQGPGIDLGGLGTLRDLNRSDPDFKAALAARYRHRIPLDDTVVTPSALFATPALVTVREQ